MARFPVVFLANPLTWGPTPLNGAWSTIRDPRAWDDWVFLIIAMASLGLRLVVRPGPAPVRVLREILLLAPAVLLYFLVRGLVVGRRAEAVDRAHDLIRLERNLRIYWEPDLQQLIVDRGWLVDFANRVYIWGHWPVIAGVALWLCLAHRDAYGVYRNALLISGGIGLVIFTLFPVAPPRLVDGMGFVDTVTLHSRAYRVFQPPDLTNPYAAMPSLHFGWNLLFALAVVRHASWPPLRVFGLVMPVLMLLAILVTANHYILDGIAGAAVALLGLAVAVECRAIVPARHPRVQTPARVTDLGR